jgi:hypothetical protein
MVRQVLRTFPVSITTANGKRSAKDADGWDALRRELDRSRRFGHPFVLLKIRPGTPGSRRRRAGEFAETIRSHVRSVDLVWARGRSVYALLPETDRGGGAHAVARLWEEVPALRTASAIAFAAFPDDGLTSGALLAALGSSALGRHPAAEASGRFHDRRRGELADALRELPAPVAQ